MGHDSPLGWWRSNRFLAQKDMGIAVGVELEVEERLSLLPPGGEAPRSITLERRWERVNGDALIPMVAHTGDPDTPTLTWENPYRPARLSRGPIWRDDRQNILGTGG